MDTTEDRALDALLSEHAARHVPPPDLARRLRQGLREMKTATPAKPPVAVRRPRWWVAAAAYAAGAATAWAMASVMLVAPMSDAVGEQVLAGHLRSLMADHLTDVASTDHHTVKPWFAGKLPFSPPVVDLAAQGFPLSGGRLDYIEGRPVAALVYRSGLHTVNLFAWPAPGLETAPVPTTRQGYHLVGWAQSGMQLWAVSDMDAGELRAFTALLQTGMRQTAFTAPPPLPPGTARDAAPAIR